MVRYIGIFLTSAIFLVSACTNKNVDPGTDREAYTPRFDTPVPLSKLGKIGPAEVDDLKNGGTLAPQSIIYEICPSCCLTCQYESTAPAAADEDEGFVDDNACIDDVQAQWDGLSTSGDKIEAYASIDFVHPKRYTEAIDNLFGLQNHIQGVKRLRKPGYFALSGGDPPRDAVLPAEVPNFLASAIYTFIDTKNRSAADLWIVNMDSKRSAGTGLWGSNLDFGPWNYPHPWDTIVLPLEVEKGEYWHPGGIDTLGDIMAIPLQAYLTTNNTKTIFLYLKDPENPVRFDFEIPFGGSKAVLHKLPSGYYLLVIGSDYMLSNSKNFADGFDYANRKSGAPGGSTAHVVKQCDGQVYMTSVGNTGSAAPTFANGDDVGSLYHIDLSQDAGGTPTGLLTDPPSLNVAPKKTLVSQKTFGCYEGGKYCNFDAAASAYVDPETKKMALYGIYHFRTDDERLKLREFK